VLKFVLTHTFLVLVTVGLRHEVYRKLYTLIGGQRAQKFENHWTRHRSALQSIADLSRAACATIL